MQLFPVRARRPFAGVPGTVSLICMRALCLRCTDDAASTRTTTHEKLRALVLGSFNLKARVLRSIACSPEATTPLTIIYEGRAFMFENFPTDKAKELIQLAGSWSTAQAPEKGAPVVLEKPVASEPSEGLDQPPIARKASV
ncbi:uncharacterized protein LOC133902974 [Phragmites australis]|uniref:uncharacterized protein LOC133902974 n=1 Tax=Phragmites australis TaxID=29695 RepID=UPI002D7789E8|nr:uncharacterized protein LOC133902974 [Phragmites australis]